MKKQSANKKGQFQVSVLNDDRNTFDHVIDTLMEVCNHSYIQAVQCATIIHKCNKASVFIDNADNCQDVHDDLLDAGLHAVITKYKSYV